MARSKQPRKGFGPFSVGASEVAARLEDYRARYEVGEKAALLEAVGYCLFNRVVAPHWIVRAFGDSLGRWKALLVPTLDAAFGMPKRKHLRAQFERNQLMFEIYAVVQKAKRSGVPVDEALFETIGEELKIGKTRVKEYLAAARRASKEKIAEQKRLNPERKTFITAGTLSVALQDRLARVMEGRKK